MKIFLNIIIILLFITLTALLSCRRCKDLSFCVMPITGEKYFGNYKEGTSWVYLNQDGTKKDSVYIQNYILNRESDKLDRCIEWDSKEMTIISNYLSTEQVLCSYNNPNCDQSIFVLGHLNISVSIHSKTGIDSLFSSIQNSNIKMIDSLVLHDGSKYYKVEKYDNRLWFAPAYGLIQFISFNDIDTFYVNKIYLQ